MKILSSIHGGVCAVALSMCPVCFGEEPPADTPPPTEQAVYLIADKENSNTDIIVDFGIRYLCYALVYSLNDQEEALDPAKNMLGVKLYMNKPLKATSTEGLSDDLKQQILSIVALCEKAEKDQEADEKTKDEYLKDITEAESALLQSFKENGVLFDKIPLAFGTIIFNKVENLQKMGLDADTDDKKNAMAQELYRALVIAGYCKDLGQENSEETDSLGTDSDIPGKEQNKDKKDAE